MGKELHQQSHCIVQRAVCSVPSEQPKTTPICLLTSNWKWGTELWKREHIHPPHKEYVEIWIVQIILSPVPSFPLKYQIEALHLCGVQSRSRSVPIDLGALLFSLHRVLNSGRRSQRLKAVTNGITWNKSPSFWILRAWIWFIRACLYLAFCHNPRNLCMCIALGLDSEIQDYSLPSLRARLFYVEVWDQEKWLLLCPITASYAWIRGSNIHTKTWVLKTGQWTEENSRCPGAFIPVV